MVVIRFGLAFRKQISKIKDSLLKERILKQIERIKDNPEIGKPMRHEKKSTREVYVAPFRLSYKYHKEMDKIEILGFYHKDEQ